MSFFGQSSSFEPYEEEPEPEPQPEPEPEEEFPLGALDQPEPDEDLPSYTIPPLPALPDYGASDAEAETSAARARLLELIRRIKGRQATLKTGGQGLTTRAAVSRPALKGGE